jgi:hypothetical protein
MNKHRIDQIANQLPSNWNELKLKDFRKLLPLKVTDQDEFDDLFVGVDNTYAVITTLTDATVPELDEIANLSPTEAKSVFDKVSFLYNSEPNSHRKPSIKLKTMDEITYNDYVLFSMFEKKAVENLHIFLSSLSKEKLTEEEALELSTEEAYVCFFFVVRRVKRYIRNLKWSLRMRLLKQTIMEMTKKLIGNRK